MKKKTTTIANVTVGKSQIAPSAPSHIRGVAQGNTIKVAKVRGLVPMGREAFCTARRSTGVNPNARNPIDPRMPNLPPA